MQGLPNTTFCCYHVKPSGLFLCFSKSWNNYCGRVWSDRRSATTLWRQVESGSAFKCVSFSTSLQPVVLFNWTGKTLKYDLNLAKVCSLCLFLAFCSWNWYLRLTLCIRALKDNLENGTNNHSPTSQSNLIRVEHNERVHIVHLNTADLLGSYQLIWQSRAIAQTPEG